MQRFSNAPGQDGHAVSSKNKWAKLGGLILRLPVLGDFLRYLGGVITKGLSYHSYVRMRPGARVGYHFDYRQEGQTIAGWVIWIQRAIILLMIAMFPFYLSIHKIDNFFFGTTKEGRVIIDAPLREPNIGTANLAAWISQAATQSLTMGFHDYNRRLRNASQHYTRKGWGDFTEFLNRERIFRSFKRSNSLILSQPATAPIVQDQGFVRDKNGAERYFWDIKLSMQMVFVGKQSDNRQYDILVRVLRVPKLESGMGISIDSWRNISN